MPAPLLVSMRPETPSKSQGGASVFDRKSDYALNKQEQDAIVCKSVTKVHIRLTRADFSSEEEFQKWKDWSDEDYHTTEQAGRGYADRSRPLEDWAVPSAPSPEDLLLAADAAMEHDAARVALAEQIRSRLTEKQYRRLCLYYLHGMNESEIAAREGVSQQAISLCIHTAKNVLKKFWETGDLTL